MPSKNVPKNPDAWALVVIVVALLLLQAPGNGGHFPEGDLRLQMEPFRAEVYGQRNMIREFVHDSVRALVETVRVR